MTINPYADNDMGDMLWEAELVADKYLEGGLILIRTKEGWRAFAGNLQEDFRIKLETALDSKVPSFEKSALLGRIDRIPSLHKELLRLLTDLCFLFDGYYPMKMKNDLEENNQEIK